MKDLDRSGSRALTIDSRTSSDQESTITVSPVTALFLKTVWGTERLTRLLDARVGFVESIGRFMGAHLRLNYIEREMEQKFQVEQSVRALAFADNTRQRQQHLMETELLKKEQLRREQQADTDIERLKAEAREHQQRAQPTEQKQTRSAREDTPPKSQFDAAWSHLALQRELSKMRKQVDECVAAGEFSEEEGEEVKQDMEEMVKAAKLKASKK